MYCRNCGAEVHAKAVACPKCGVPPFIEKLFCAECGSPTKENQVICTQCGVSLNSNTTKSTHENSEVSSSKSASISKKKLQFIVTFIMLFTTLLPWYTGGFFTERGVSTINGLLALAASVAIIVSLYFQKSFSKYMAIFAAILGLTSTFWNYKYGEYAMNVGNWSFTIWLIIYIICSIILLASMFTKPKNKE